MAKNSSNINEVTRTVLNLFFLLKKDFVCTKSTKKHQRSIKKHQKAQKCNQTKVQNAKKQTKIKNMRFCVLCAHEEKKIENKKNKKSLQCHVLNTNVLINHFRCTCMNRFVGT